MKKLYKKQLINIYHFCELHPVCELHPDVYGNIVFFFFDAGTDSVQNGVIFAVNEVIRIGTKKYSY